MSNKQESIMSGIAVVLLLFTAMLDPVISTTLAVILLIGFSVYKYTESTKH